MDRNYFEQIYTKYFKVLHLFSARMVGDNSVAEDIVQDVFMECWARRNSLGLSSSLQSYLYKLVYNRSLDFLKSAKSKNVSISDETLFLENLYFSAFAVEDRIDAERIANEIDSCVTLLPEKCREVFLLSRSSNLKNREIAEKLNISIKAVEKHISKALQDIRKHLLDVGCLRIILIISVLPPPPF